MKIRAIVIEPLDTPQIKYIENDLRGLQSIVGGLIERVPFTDTCDVVINEEGKLNGSLPNRGIWPDENGKFQDVVFGTMCFVGVDHEEGEYISISDADAKKVIEQFRNPEIWVFG